MHLDATTLSQSSRVLLLLSLLPSACSVTFTSPLPAFSSVRGAISRRNAGVRDENWYRSYVKSIIATSGPSVSGYCIPRRQRSYLSTSPLTFVAERTRSLALSPSLYPDVVPVDASVALIAARPHLLHPKDLLRPKTEETLNEAAFITENIAHEGYA